MVRTALLLIFLLAAPSQAWAIDKAELVAKVEKRFASIKGFRARFKQSALNAAFGEVEESTGNVTLKKPLMMRWEYDEPKQTIIVDGKAVYFYLPEEKQVMVEPLGKMLSSRSPALFLAGDRKLAELFFIELAGVENKDKMKTSFALSLRPKEESISVTRMVVGIDGADFTIRSLILYDWAGNRTEIEFVEMEINGEIDNRTFNFEKPPGVEQVEMPRLDFGVE